LTAGKAETFPLFLAPCRSKKKLLVNQELLTFLALLPKLCWHALKINFIENL
jgi:hypothetical protein